MSLSDEERIKASRLRNEADKERFLAAHGLLRELLSGYLGTAAEGLQFRSGSRGKPELVPQGDARAISFNLSHTRRWAAVAVAKSLPVGVDIEEVHPALDVDGMAQMVLSEAEQAVLAGLAPAQRRRSFVTAWVCKEAVLKAIGRGLGDGARDVVVPGEVLAGGTGGEGSGFDCVIDCGRSWRVRSLDFADDGIGAVAAPDVGWTLRCLAFGAPRA